MISIIIPWKNRDEIYRSIFSFIKVAETINAEIILVNYNGTLDHTKLPANNKLRIITVDDCKHFNKASANNIGASFARHSLLFFCDCDILLSTDVIRRCAQLLKELNTFVTIKHAQEEKLNSLESNHIQCFGYNMIIKTRDGRQAEIIDFEEDTSTGLRNAPGLLFVKADDFKAINGYSGFLQGWGWEDQDMICRLTLGLGLKRKQHGTLVHLSHDDQARIGEYPPISNRWESRDRMFRTAISRYDQNQFHGTYTEDFSNHTLNELKAV